MTDPAVPIDTPEIPDKLYFRIGEVASLLAVEPYVLRYWETEFRSLAPKKSGTGHRLYRRKDVELLLKIKQFGPLAQRLEQRTHNPLVVGSNPTGPTSRTFATST